MAGDTATWLHISDFHIKEGDGYDRDVVLRALVEHVKQHEKPDLIFATGDIAFSGKPAEYRIATQFFESLLRAAGLKRDQLVVIPGNHNVDRDEASGLARTLTSREDADKYFAKPRAAPHLDAYYDWHSTYFGGKRPDSTCGPVMPIAFGNYKVAVLPINSALFCRDDFDHGKLCVGRRSLDAALDALRKESADLKLALIHHPIDWLSDIERYNIKTALQSAARVVLRGHLHETEVETIDGQTIYCGAGASYRTRRESNRAMYVTFDGDSLTIEPIRYEDAPRERWTLDTSLFDGPTYTKRFPFHSTPAPAAPSKPRPVSRCPTNLPYRAENLPFVGRDDLLAQILSGHKSVVLHGEAGVGKSELAREFARRNRARYPGGIFVLDATAGDCSIDFATIGKTYLDLNYPDGLPIQDQSRKALYSLPTEATLLIYDNSPNPQAMEWWLATAEAVEIIVTSVHESWPGWHRIKVERLPPEQSVQLVRELTSAEIATKYGARIAEVAEGLPVQICPTALTVQYELRHGRVADVKATLAVETKTSFRRVWDRLDLDARLLLKAAAMFNPVRIPRDELARFVSDFERNLDACIDLQVLDGAAELRMHQLFSAFVLETPDWGAVTGLRAKQRTRLVELARGVDDKPTNALLASALSCYRIDPAAWQTFDGDDLGWVGRALHRIGRFDDSLLWHQAAVAAKEASGADGESLGSSLHNVGYCLGMNGHRKEARDWHERAAKASERGDKQGRVDHDSIGISMHAVGYCLWETGQYEEARGWYRRAVDEQKQGDIHGRIDHDSIGNSLHQIGYCLSETGQYEEARSWYERAVDEQQQGDIHGRVDHDSIGKSLNQVGQCLSEIGQYEEARGWCEHAINEKQQGDIHGRIDHESLGRSLNQVGCCLANTSRWSEARDWFDRAVQSKRNGDKFGRRDNKSLANSLRRLADCLRKLDRNSEADQHDREANQLDPPKPDQLS